MRIAQPRRAVTYRVCPKKSVWCVPSIAPFVAFDDNPSNGRTRTMKLSKLLTVVALAGFASVASADLEPWTDYDISESVMNVTTVKVDSRWRSANGPVRCSGSPGATRSVAGSWELGWPTSKP